MKKISLTKITVSLLIFFLLVIYQINAIAQQKSLRPNYNITADSLLVLFSKMKPFEVFEYVNILRIDYFDCYQNEELRKYLLKWIDKETYIEHRINSSIKIVFDERNIDDKIKNWLINKGFESHIDSVLNDNKLHALYLDSIINEYKSTSHKRLSQQGCSLHPSALNFHARLKLPEAYDVINKYWVADGKTQQSIYFNVMLSMQDPEAVEIANNYIENAIENNDLQELKHILGNMANNNYYGNYTVDWKIKLLRVTIKTSYGMLSGDLPFKIPFNICVLDPFTDSFFSRTDNEVVLGILNKLFNPIDKIYRMKEKEFNIISQEITNNLEEFKRATYPLKEKMIESERYWKENMPYNK
jgi:hypothetical protein